MKEKKVIRDKTAQPWQRVALREIKDFAIPLNVGVSGEYEIFWKYFLADNDETKLLIKENLRKRKLFSFCLICLKIRGHLMH